MPIYYGNKLELLNSHFSQSLSEIIIISAFCTSRAVRELLNNVPNSVKVTLVTRWSKYDIISGSSDLEVANIIFEKGGRIFRNSRLHAKIYIIDKEKLFFGSANMTSRGFALAKHESNIECLSELENTTTDDILFVNSLINDSDIVNQAFVDELQKQIKEDKSHDWDESKIQEISSKPKGIFVNDFPFCKTPISLIEDECSINIKHDIRLFNLPSEELRLNIIRPFFEKSNIVKWLQSKVDDKMSFGELSKNIHDALLDDPKPYRKEVKELEVNLLNWISILLDDKFRIYVPPGRHSQIIEKIC